jgi:hypothetical protein
MQKVRIGLCFVLVSMLLFTTTAFAAKSGSLSTLTDEFGNKVTLSKVKISDKVVSSLPNTTVIADPAEPDTTGDVQPNDIDFPWNGHTHSVTNVHKGQYNLYNVLTDYCINNYQKDTSNYPTLSWQIGQSTEVSASVSYSAGVSLKMVEASTTATIGVSKTFTASTTYTFPVPYGQAGRIIFRYSQDHYTFTCNKIYDSGTVTSTPGNGWSSAYSTGYYLQTYYLWF